VIREWARSDYLKMAFHLIVKPEKLKKKGEIGFFDPQALLDTPGVRKKTRISEKPINLLAGGWPQFLLGPGLAFGGWPRRKVPR
jgi:hypothetical protein